MKKELIYRGCETTESAGDELYLIRWKIIDRPGFGLFLHKFLKSDLQDLHDHPWNFISVILWRGYNDVTPASYPSIGRGRQRVYPGMVLFRRAIHRHRVELINDKPALTLILRFGKVRNWGFWIKGTWVHWRNYWTSKGC